MQGHSIIRAAETYGRLLPDNLKSSELSDFYDRAAKSPSVTLVNILQSNGGSIAREETASWVGLYLDLLRTWRYVLHLLIFRPHTNYAPSPQCAVKPSAACAHYSVWPALQRGEGVYDDALYRLLISILCELNRCV